jgi:hypothetical protein
VSRRTAAERDTARLLGYLAAVYHGDSVLAQHPTLPGRWVLYIQTVAGRLVWTVSASDLDVLEHVRHAEPGDLLAVWSAADAAASRDVLHDLVTRMTP